VTNARFHQFVLAGSYSNMQLWREQMSVSGQTLPRAAALATFVDRPGVPGPRSWSSGSFPQAEAEHPVVGICWYEAEAFARWAGKQLPSLARWWRAAMDDRSAGFPWGEDARTAVQRANFSGIAAQPVGSF